MKARDMLDKSILDHPRYQAIHNARQRSAERARLAQSKYRNTSMMFIVATTGAAIVGGLLLYGLDSSAVQSPPVKKFVARSDVQTTLIIAQALFLAAAAYFGVIQSRLRYDKTWIDNRIKAEAGRLDRARATLEIGHETGPEAFSSAGKNFLKEIGGRFKPGGKIVNHPLDF